MLPNDDVLSETERYKKSEGDPNVKDDILFLSAWYTLNQEKSACLLIYFPIKEREM